MLLSMGILSNVVLTSAVHADVILSNVLLTNDVATYNFVPQFEHNTIGSQNLPNFSVK